jgi:hypothetical protein
LRSDDFLLNIFSTNIDPTCMSLKELNDGFVSMCEHLYTPEAYSTRCLGEIARLQCTPTRYSNYPIPILYLALGLGSQVGKYAIKNTCIIIPTLYNYNVALFFGSS